MKRFAWLFAGVIAIIIGGFALQKPSANHLAPETGQGFTIYTTGQATSPQIPFWAALDRGDLDLPLNIKFWKSLDNLQGLMLAGKGDLWVGHVDGFAKAASRGAPVQLLSVTGWKKFYILSRDKNIKSFDDFLALPKGHPVAIAPPHSPVVPVLRAMEATALPHFHYVPQQPKQLALSVMKNESDLVILPEPLVTVLLHKVPELKIIANVEAEYGKMMGKDPVLPLAGIAINTNTARQHPELAAAIRDALEKQEARLRMDPASGIAALPKSFEGFIAKDLALQSMQRDLIRVETAQEAKAAILEYLDLITPEGASPLKLPDTFFGHEQP